MEVGLVEREIDGSNPQRQRLESVRRQLGVLLQAVRDLSQLLHPPALDDLGLVPALQSLVGKFMQQSQIEIMLKTPENPPRLPHAIELAVYRVVQEALTNMARHSRARTGAIELATEANAVRLRIADDGCGFDPEQQRRSANSGTGLTGMRERIAAHGGELEVESRPQAGTRLQIMIPLNAPQLITKEHDDEDPHAARR
jgi:signal transduction histidine kinase